MSDGYVNDTTLLSGLLYKAENYTNLTANFADDLTTVSDFQPNVSFTGSAAKMSWLSGGKIQIPFYTIILLLSVVGNLLVISTLVQNRRMRTITNLFLLNLAISDILLGVLCMPVTLVGTLLRHFIFGAFLCKLIPFLQATSVAVSSWTLVAISCERYYAICHPLRSRTWQTINHAYKIIGFIWIGSFVCMSPIAGFSQLIPTSQGLRKCREYWPEDAIVYERTYNILLDLILLVLPLMVLCAAYILITRTLYMGMKNEKIIKNSNTALNVSITVSFRQDGIDQEEFQQYERGLFHNNGPTVRHRNHLDEIQRRKIYPDTRLTNYSRSPSMKSFERRFNGNTNNGSRISQTRKTTSTPVLKYDSILRKSNVTKNLESKRRVVKMLFVLVLEFFICWTPLYVINTMTLFNPALIYQNVGYTAISFLQLLAYSSSCCNPITYCFMNAGFRRAFLDTFKGLHAAGRCWRKPTPTSNGALESPKIQSRH